MRKAQSIVSSILLSLVLFAAGCGDTSSGSTTTSPTNAKIVISTELSQTIGPPPDVPYIKNIDLTVVLPNGVTPKKNINGIIDKNSYILSGNAWNILLPIGQGSVIEYSSSILYTPATTQAPGTIKFTQGSAVVGLGEFFTVLLDIDARKKISNSDFIISGFSAVDLTLVPLNIFPSLRLYLL